jgi:NAD(P)-dependent dehydrogenase (short-subunit alcohol dehydrogenase family)
MKQQGQSGVNTLSKGERTMQLKQIKDQVVVIMGASSGIGRETALLMGRRRAKLVVSARDSEGLESLCSEIRDAGGNAIYQTCDVANFEEVKSVAQRAVSEYGRLDTWIHAAAVYLVASFEETTPEEFRRIIDVNLNGQAYGAMAALPHLRQTGGGSLIHVTSVEAEVPLPLQSAYAASKHGVAGFIESLRLELEHDNIPIAVTNVMPATINTPLFEHARTKIGSQPQGLPPVYDPRIVAEVIAYAAENPSRDLYAGGAGWLFSLAHRVSPRLTDAFLLRQFDRLKSEYPKGANGGDNLYEGQPMERAEGPYGDRSRSYSLYSWMETHPGVRKAVTGGMLGIAGLWAIRGLRKGHD